MFVLGFITLFLELVLIRYLAANIWNLGYFPNLVLIAVFIGLGAGFLFHRSFSETDSARLFCASGMILLLLTLFVPLLHPAMPGFGTVEGYFGGDSYSTYAPTQSAGGGKTLFLGSLLAVGAIFACLAQRTAKAFRALPPLDAYTANVAGSCSGIVCFMAMSWQRLPAYVWFAVALPPFWSAAGSESRAWRRALMAALLLCVAVVRSGDQSLLADPRYRGPIRVTWSPYQKIEYAVAPGGISTIYANGITFQFMLGREFLGGAHGLGVPYTLPYEERAKQRDLPPYKNVLILGAGSGNDVAAALAGGAAHVDAVEIDPVIVALGREHHPLRPYGDPRVDVIVDDGRDFLTRVRRKYDLIVFALTDSLVKVSPVAQLRLENYLYTQQAISRAYSLLNDRGNVLIYSFCRRPWMFEKLAQMLALASGGPPKAIYSARGLVMLLGKDYSGAPPAPLSTGGDLPEDDWPFLYLQRRGIPPIYAAAMALLALVGVGIMLVFLRRARRRPQLAAIPGATLAAFLFMGIAFSLLETKSVIQFSLLFGTTWINNSLVFLAVLLLVLAANKSVSWARAVPAWLLYLLLGFSCLATAVYPLGNLLVIESAAARFLLAALMTFLPIYFANIVFSAALRGQEAAEHALGWNLLGAMFGGIVEYFSLWLGYNALSLIVALCYAATFLLLRRGARAA